MLVDDFDACIAGDDDVAVMDLEGAEFVGEDLRFGDEDGRGGGGLLVLCGGGRWWVINGEGFDDAGMVEDGAVVE